MVGDYHFSIRGWLGAFSSQNNFESGGRGAGTMSIPTFHHKEADLKRAWGALPAVLLSVVAALAAVAAIAVFFWPNDIDPEVRATLRSDWFETRS